MEGLPADNTVRDDGVMHWRDYRAEWEQQFGEGDDEEEEEEEEDEWENDSEFFGSEYEDEEEDEWEHDSEFENSDEDEEGFYVASRPADEGVVENLPGIPGPVRREVFPEGWEENCAVCLEEIEGFRPVGKGDGEVVVVSLPGCGHWFHGKCIKAWLSHQDTCPVCRKELKEDKKSPTIIHTDDEKIVTAAAKTPEMICREWMDHWLFQYWTKKVPHVRFSRHHPSSSRQHTRWKPCRRDLAELNRRLAEDSGLYWAREGWPVAVD